MKYKDFTIKGFYYKNIKCFNNQIHIIKIPLNAGDITLRIKI